MAKNRGTDKTTVTDLGDWFGDDGVLTGDESDGATLDPRVAELESLRARVAELEAEKARAAAAPASPVWPAGQRFLVRLTDAPTWVVEVLEGEHPWDAYRRVTGVVNSTHAPSITATDAAVGRVLG